MVPLEVKGTGTARRAAGAPRDASELIEGDDGTNALALFHELEGLVDVFKAECMGDEFVDFELSVEVIRDVIGKLGASANAAEGRAFPDASGDELEGARGDFLSCTCDADDDGFSPSAVRAFEGGAHDVDISDALKAVIHAAVGQFHDHFLDRLAVIVRVDHIGRTELFGEFE